MQALEVLLNGKPVCVASAGEAGLVISNVVLTGAGVGEPFAARFRVGGVLDEQHLEWVSRGITLGDVVEIRVVDAPKCDPPSSVDPVTDDQRARLAAAIEKAEGR
jgi:hypothetical protein